jgi:hypothetical protein
MTMATSWHSSSRRREIASLLTLAGALLAPAKGQVVLESKCHTNSYWPASEFGRAVSGSGSGSGSGTEGIVIGAPGMEEFDGQEITHPGGVVLPLASTVLFVRGEEDGDRFGAAVAGGLRLNADSTLDVLVGAPLHDGLSADGGSVYALSGADGSILYVVHGTGNTDEFGTAIARVGDVDGDGFDDFLAGGPQRFFDVSGYAKLISGSDGAVIRTHSGAHIGSWFGLGLAALGDIDLDDVPDYAIGAPREKLTGFAPTGRVRIYSGATGVVLGVLDGQAQGEDFGYSLGSGADIDRDGFDDLAVGAPGFALQSPGRARVYSGLSGALLLTLTGSYDDDWFGASLAGASDFDGDGHGDVVVGAPGADPLGPFEQPSSGPGYAEVRSGKDGSTTARLGGHYGTASVGVSVAALKDYDGDGLSDVLVGGRMNNDGYGDHSCVEVLGRSGSHEVRVGTQPSLYGHSVAAAGDVNLDGTPDLLVGAPASGFVHVLSGLDRSLIHELHAGPQGGQFGRAVARAGDVDGDGYEDILVGSAMDRFDAWPAAPPGYAEIHSGRTGQLIHHLPGPGDPAFGRAVSGGEDVNADGFDDVIVGGAQVELQGVISHSNAGSFYSPGNVRVYSGRTGSVLYAFDGTATDAVGFSVAMLGDLTGDGYAEFMFGAPGRPEQISTGVVELHSGLNGSLLHSFSTIEARNGTAVCRLGDADGDGVEDLAFSTWDPSGIWSYGAVFVYSGSDFSQLWKEEAKVPYLGPTFGYSLSSAGDVNGDGHDDVLVGTPGIGAVHGMGIGAVSVLAGPGDNLPLGPMGYAGWDYFGYSVAGLGDLNGDGKPEFVVGAPTDPSNIFGAEPGWNRVHVMLSNYLSTFQHCPQAANSSGGAASIHARGLGDVALNSLSLGVQGAPAGVSGVFLLGEETAVLPFMDGFLCVQGQVARIPPGVMTSAAGTASKDIDLTTAPANVIQPGTQWSFQFWFRDPGVPGGTGANLSDAVRVQFLP